MIIFSDKPQTGVASERGVIKPQNTVAGANLFCRNYKAWLNLNCIGDRYSQALLPVLMLKK